MPTAPPQFVAHALELLAPLGAVEAKRMFGGHGVYCGGVFVAIIIDDTLYLKADAENRAEFEDAGCEPFTYARRGKAARLGFYRVPEDALDAPHLMRPWAMSALGAALRARKSGAQKKTGRARRPVSTKRKRKA